jgi:hypothetical protein
MIMRHYSNMLVMKERPENSQKECDVGYNMGYIEQSEWVMGEGDEYIK